MNRLLMTCTIADNYPPCEPPCERSIEQDTASQESLTANCLMLQHGPAVPLGSMQGDHMHSEVTYVCKC